MRGVPFLYFGFQNDMLADTGAGFADFDDYSRVCL